MKKIILTILLITSFQQLTLAQDTLWRKGGIAALSISQTSLSNWAGGGENAISGTGIVSFFANYKKDRVAWDNSLDLAYGLLKQGDADIRKNEDKIDVTSKYGYAIHPGGKFYYSILANIKSQFADGYNYPNDSVIISRFAAPLYGIISIGLDYKPNKDFSVMLSPATGKMTIVNDQDLADAGAYGVDKAEYDQFLNKTKDGSMVRYEIGAYLNARFQKDVMKNVNLLTKLDLFSNYLDNPQNIDVNWEVLIAMKVNKLLTVTLSTQLIYDDNIDIAEFETVNKVKVPRLRSDGTPVVGPRTQFKEVLGIGIAYKFVGYRVR